ncbi:hypothetical protein B0J11DRAFT_596642 [Dendryphion nanum]|uniref:RING-type domain-containing protein n=1 Tax=Dendryphion nanum TaxID=256645 RepID=A0A9P9EFB1_9PLEO|nr:hypothetical protein B0J11DRAFT_596642 [Dendryphion nanum]
MSTRRSAFTSIHKVSTRRSIFTKFQNSVHKLTLSRNPKKIFLDDLAQIEPLRTVIMQILHEAIGLSSASSKDRFDQFDLPETFSNLLVLGHNLDLTELNDDTVNYMYSTISRHITVSNHILQSLKGKDVPKAGIASYQDAKALYRSAVLLKTNLKYRIYKKRYFILPILNELLSEDAEAYREIQSHPIAAARVYWLQRPLNSDRKLDWNVSSNYLQSKLNRKYHNLISSMSSPEWNFFEAIVGYTTLRTQTFPALEAQLNNWGKLRAQGNLFIDHRDLVPLTECTSEAMQSNDPECCVCFFDFGPQYSRVDETEPAFKTTCGHFIGQDCAHKLVETRDFRCPICRQSLVDYKMALPDRLRTTYLQMAEIIVAIKDLDLKVNGYLLDGEQEIFDEQFGELLLELHSLAVAFAKHYKVAIVELKTPPRTVIDYASLRT